MSSIAKRRGGALLCLAVAGGTAALPQLTHAAGPGAPGVSTAILPSTASAVGAAPVFVQLRTTGRAATCLTVDGTGPSATVVLATCDAPEAQAWRFEPKEGRLRWGADDQCLRATSPNVVIGRAIRPSPLAWTLRGGRSTTKPTSDTPRAVLRVGACDDEGARGWSEERALRPQSAAITGGRPVLRLPGAPARSTSTFRHRGLALCVDPSGKNQTVAGTVVGLGACGDADQSFFSETVPPTVTAHSLASFGGTSERVTELAPKGRAAVIGSVRLLNATAAAFSQPSFGGTCRVLEASEAVLKSPIASLRANATCPPGQTQQPPAPLPVFAADRPLRTSPWSAHLRLRAVGLCLVGALDGSVQLGACGPSFTKWTQTAIGDLASDAANDAGARCVHDTPGGLRMATCDADRPQGFDLLPDANDDAFVRIVDRATGRCLAAVGNVVSGASVSLASCDLGDRARWTWGEAKGTTPVAESAAVGEAGTMAPRPGDDRLVAANDAYWPGGVVPVCWENLDQAEESMRDAVQQAVEGSWGAVAKLTFTGWDRCPPPAQATAPAVRILVSDTPELNHPKSTVGPTSVMIGGPSSARTNADPGFRWNRGDGLAPTMLLNFTFRNFNSATCLGRSDWDCAVYRRGPGCENRRRTCVETIGVHEFGHALGFRHEQAREDTPSSCTQRNVGADDVDETDVKLTSHWDEDSVMNYCNGRSARNADFLSAGDVEGVRKAYGDPTPRVVVYQDRDYLGTAAVYVGDVPGFSGVNDSASSIILINTSAVAVYEDSNYRGKCETLTADAPALSAHLIGNDSISSLRVGRTCDGTTGGAPLATLYLDADYGGQVVPVYADAIARLSERGINDAVSSIRLGPGVTVGAAYDDADFAGTCVDLFGDTPRLSATRIGNDSLSSLRVGTTCEGLTSPPSAGVRLFDDAGFSGESILFARDVPSLGARGFNDRASAVQLVGVAIAALYDDSDFRGQCLTVGGSIERISTTLLGNDSVSSLRVGVGCLGETSVPVAGARIYEDGGFGGRSVLVSRDLDRTSLVGMHDNTSSIRLEGGVQVAAVYQDAGFGGVCSTITGDVPSTSALSVGNDSISSIIVGRTCEGLTSVPTAGVRLFVDTGFGGRSILLPQDTPRLSALGWNDDASSVRLEGVLVAALYQDADYQGRCQTVIDPIGQLSPTTVGNDSVSSVRVGRTCDGLTSPPQGGIRLFWDTYHRGESIFITGDVPSIGSHWNDEASSVRIEGYGVGVASLYRDSWYRGRCTTVWGPIDRLSEHSVGNDEVTSIRIGVACP
ncbi:beta/gamma crystallin-related protein [Myxococcota bacterium]|nr:beta/gamma crystallin-related protein [Myxococcota bacterium]